VIGREGNVGDVDDGGEKCAVGGAVFSRVGGAR
jgi:hypothetical protein